MASLPVSNPKVATQVAVQKKWICPPQMQDPPRRPGKESNWESIRKNSKDIMSLVWNYFS